MCGTSIICVFYHHILRKAVSIWSGKCCSQSLVQVLLHATVWQMICQYVLVCLSKCKHFPLQVVTTGWTHHLHAPEITSNENGKTGECGICVVCTHPSCQDCLWRSTWEWHQCLDRREVSACHSPPDPLCPREPTPPDTHPHTHTH